MPVDTLNNTYNTNLASAQPIAEKTYTWPNGNQNVTFSYTGNFVDNKRHGKGTLTGSNGDTYEGDFENDEITGKGIYRWADGKSYKGDVINGRQSGKGIFTWVNGNKYEGNFDGMDRINKGIFTSANGNRHPVDFESQKYYYLTGLAGKIESAAANLSSMVDEWLNGKDAVPTHKKITRIVVGHLLKPISMTINAIVSAISTHFAEKIDPKHYQKAFSNWASDFSSSDENTRECYIDQLIRAKVCFDKYATIMKDPILKNMDLTDYFSGAGLQDTSKREKFVALTDSNYKDVTAKGRQWVFKNTIISKDTKEDPIQNKVVFKIDKNTITKLSNEYPGVNGNQYDYSIHIENDLKNCTSVEFHINQKIKTLPKAMSLRLIQLLQDARPSGYCCVDFLNSMHGKFTKLNDIYINEWKFVQSNQKYITGDAVTLCNKESSCNDPSKFDYKHFAIYVGSKTFMSVYGGLPIIFSTMDQMKQNYSTKETLTMYPVNN